MTNRERAAKAILTAYGYQWIAGYAPRLHKLEASEEGRNDILTSVADLLTDLRHWAKFNGVNFKTLLARSKWMFEEEDAGNCKACNEGNEALEHTCW